MSRSTLRLLHIITSGQRRGGDVFASDLAAALRDLGVMQRVAVVRAPSPIVVPFEVPVSVLGRGGPSLPGLRMQVGVARRLRQLIRVWKPQVIQAHGGEPFKYAVAADPVGRLPIVYRRIGGAPAWITRGLGRVGHAQLMRRATMIVAVADSLRRETMDLFRVDPGSIRTIPNAVSAARLEPVRERAAIRRELRIGNEVVVTLSLGALSWEKDPLAQLEIVHRVLNECPETGHLFVGDGPMQGEIEDEVLRRRLSGRCHILGSRSDVGDIFAASDVFLFASRADGMEGMPASVIEAGMAGVPVAAYSIMGVPEVVEHGVTGLLAPSGDADALTSHVLELASDPDRRGEMGSAARKRCRSSFDIRTIAPRYLELYEELADQ